MSENDKKAIDIEFLRNVIEEDYEFEKELFAIFIENAQRNISKMEDSIKNNDNNAWYMASHAFKGAAASIGAFTLSKILEYAQKHPEEQIEQKQELIAKVKEEFARVQEFIKEEMAGK